MYNVLRSNRYPSNSFLIKPAVLYCIGSVRNVFRDFSLPIKAAFCQQRYLSFSWCAKHRGISVLWKNDMPSVFVTVLRRAGEPKLLSSQKVYQCALKAHLIVHGRIHGLTAIRYVLARTDSSLGQKRHFCMVSTRVWRTDRRMDGRTNGRTDRRTYPLIEMRERI